MFNSTGGHGCQPCSCDPVGAVQGDCGEEGEGCVCRENVEGDLCDQCAPGYTGLFSENGCQGKLLVSMVTNWCCDGKAILSFCTLFSFFFCSEYRH